MTPVYQGPKGAPDWLPDRSATYDHVIDRAVAVLKSYGLLRIETPIFESTDVFLSGLAESSEIVVKQMYTFEDKGGRSLTLRPDRTAPVIRSVIEHNLHRKLPLPLQLFYTGPVFRHEKPQAGRYRQHFQVGFEFIGTDGPASDAQAYELCRDVYRGVGIDADGKVNSIGHPECRAVYLPLLVDFLNSHLTDLCSDCKRKVETNPLRTFDCKVESDRKLMQAAPKITDHLCDECAEHYADFKKELAERDLTFKEDPTLVRGLDYYCRTLFEFTSKTLGSQDAVGGGGRYDGLSEALGGPSLPGLGAGLGVDRMVLALEGAGFAMARKTVLVASGEHDAAAGRRAVRLLRESGIDAVDGGAQQTDVSAQMRFADRSGIGLVVITKGEALTIRDMESGKQEEVDETELASRVRTAL